MDKAKTDKLLDRMADRGIVRVLLLEGINERRLNTLYNLLESTLTVQLTNEVCQIATFTLSKNPVDIPFALLYLINENRTQARLAGTTGLEPNTAASPMMTDLTVQHKPGSWPLAEVAHTGQPQQVDNLETQFSQLPNGFGSESPSKALVLPVAQLGVKLPVGLLVVGINPRNALTLFYHSRQRKNKVQD
jgi:hypothetical protein